MITLIRLQRNPFGMAGGAALGQAANIGMGLLLGGWQDRRQARQDKRLGAQQLARDKELTDYQYGKQMQMWKDTNYSAQVEELEKAGLNPGLIYGMGGGGGTTTGAGAAHSGGTNAAPEQSGIMGMMQLKQQMEMNQAQQELIQAQTEKTKAETAKTSGVDTKLTETQTLNLLTGIDNQKATRELTKIETRLKQIDAWIKEDTYDEAVANIVTAVDRAKTELSMLKMDRDITSTTYNDKIKIIQQEAIAGLLKNSLNREQINTEKGKQQEIQASIQKMAMDIVNAANEIMIKEGHLKIEALKARIMDENQSPLNVLGGVMRKMGETWLNALKKIMEKPTTKIE